MAKAKKLPSGSWRVQPSVTVDGKKYVESFTDPSRIVAEMRAKEWQDSYKTLSWQPEKSKFGIAAEKYIADREHILSPKTVSEYRKLIKNNLQDIVDIPLKDIVRSGAVLQQLANNLSAYLSPKSVRNVHGFVIGVIRYYIPGFVATTKLPEMVKNIKELPEPEVIIHAVMGTDIELPCLLAIWLSFSMSEIRGLTKSKSLTNGGTCIMVKEVVVDVDGTPVRKAKPKAYERVRETKLPPYIKDLIDKVDGDIIVPKSGASIYNRFIHIMAKNGIYGVTFHNLRHLSASVMLQLNVPKKYAKERGGWKTDSVYETIYGHTFQSARQTVDEQIDNYFAQIVTKTD